MKRTLSIFLALVMMLSCFAVCFAASAADGNAVACTCKNHKDKEEAPKGCHCCVYCPNLDKTYLTSCVRTESGELNAKNVGFCKEVNKYGETVWVKCDKCTGIWPCKCGHDCCDPYEQSIDNPNGPILTPDQQEQVTTGFQGFIKKVKALFDDFFNKIFDFLKVGELFPDLLPKT